MRATCFPCRNCRINGMEISGFIVPTDITQRERGNNSSVKNHSKILFMKTEGDCHPQILLLLFDSKDTESENFPLSSFFLSFFFLFFCFLDYENSIRSFVPLVFCLRPNVDN